VPIAVVGLAAFLTVVAGLVCWFKLPTALGATPATNSPPGIEDDRKIFSAYAGSASCQECHHRQYELWSQSSHRFAERALQPELDRPAFDPPRAFKHGTQSTETRLRGADYEIVTPGFHTNAEPYRVARVIGRDPLRQFLAAAPGGRWQALETAYDPKSNAWFDVYGDEDRKPGEWGHWTGRGMNWNSTCATCHNTCLRKNYDAATDSYHTTMAEMAVGCEACHGPLKAHVEWRGKNPNTKRPDPTISKLSRDQTQDTCAACHARRDELTGDFKPGDSFFDHFSLEILNETDRWHPDGQVRDEDYEFTSFLGSRMIQSGVHCRDCHRTDSGKGNALCLRCHQGNFPGFTNAPVINPAQHGHHKLDDEGGGCVGCHMPATVYMQRHPRHDHAFTISDPLLTKQLNIPNACNRCHTDQSVDWALKYTGQWYGAGMNRHTRERTQWIAAAQHGEPAGRDRLIGMLTKGGETPYWRAVAAGMLWPWAGEPETRTTLVARLKDEHPLVREKAARSLEPPVENGNVEASAALKPMLNDPMRCVRVAAAWVLRATVDMRSRAGRELQQALDLNADQPTGQYRLAMFQLARQQPEEALAHLRKAVAWDPFSPPLRSETARVLSQLDRPAEAVEQLQVACRLEPQSADYCFKLGLAWAEAKKLDQAIVTLEAAVKLDPQHARAWYNLGLARSAVEKTTEALEALNRAESLAPRDPQIPYARATILARLGRYDEMRDAARKALELQPDFQPARELLQQLPARR